MKSEFTLVPSEFFRPESAGEIISKVVPLAEGEPLSFLDIPSYKAVFIYAGKTRPVIYDMLMSLVKIGEYNKIIASYSDGELSLVVAQGDGLQFCNVFHAVDFTTAQYYIFLALKSLQLNPQLSTLHFMGEVTQDEISSMYNYFKRVEVLR